MGSEETPVNIVDLDKKGLKALSREMTMIFQDPYSSLNPRMSVLDIIGEPFVIHKVVSSRRKLESEVAELLRMVRLEPEYMKRYPHAFSGGQRQRIAIARALALRPKIVIADEPVSALDVSVQAQILNLLKELQQELDLTFLFVAHDLSVVEYISGRIAVMYVGKMVEVATSEELFAQPKHPYTSALLSSNPQPDPRTRSERVVLQGEVANPADPPLGCYFNPRCSYATDVCRSQPPQLTEISPNHFVSCHRAEELELPGVAMAKADGIG